MAGTVDCQRCIQDAYSPTVKADLYNADDVEPRTVATLQFVKRRAGKDLKTQPTDIQNPAP
jgi:hypothetical protein